MIGPITSSTGGYTGVERFSYTKPVKSAAPAQAEEHQPSAAAQSAEVPKKPVQPVTPVASATSKPSESLNVELSVRNSADAADLAVRMRITPAETDAAQAASPSETAQREQQPLTAAQTETAPNPATQAETTPNPAAEEAAAQTGVQAEEPRTLTGTAQEGAVQSPAAETAAPVGGAEEGPAEALQAQQEARETRRQERLEEAAQEEQKAQEKREAYLEAQEAAQEARSERLEELRAAQAEPETEEAAAAAEEETPEENAAAPVEGGEQEERVQEGSKELSRIAALLQNHQMTGLLMTRMSERMNGGESEEGAPGSDAVVDTLLKNGQENANSAAANENLWRAGGAAAFGFVA